jgi:hypothetical protein
MNNEKQIHVPRETIADFILIISMLPYLLVARNAGEPFCTKETGGPLQESIPGEN